MSARRSDATRPPEARGDGASRLVNRNIVAGIGRTSMRLEPEIWESLAEICAREATPLGELIRRIEAKAAPGGRTSAVRVFVLNYFREAATEEGHARRGHGRRGSAHG